MKNLWNDEEAARCEDALALRVYSSRLLGREPSLVLHGGGNTSVKATVTDLFDDAFVIDATDRVDFVLERGGGTRVFRLTPPDTRVSAGENER